jgi:hypothetical protein
LFDKKGSVMKIRALPLIAFASILSICGAAFVKAQKEADSVLARVSNYRQWTRVTREPVPVPVPNTVAVDIATGGG